MFFEGDVLRRAINPIYFKQYNALKDSGFFKTLIKNKLLIPHTQTTVSDKQIVITPEPIAFITNPYEWSFEQYKHAALHTVNSTIFKISFAFPYLLFLLTPLISNGIAILSITDL